jgi:ferredoxin-type protein NapH
MARKLVTVRRALGFVSFLTFPVVVFYLSPMLILSNASMGVMGASALMFSALFVSSLFLGRAYCGWLCPAGGGMEACAAVNGRPVSGKVNILKYLVFFPWIAVIVVLFIKAGGIKAVDFFIGMPYGISLDEPWKYLIYAGILALVFGMSLLFGRRFFCHGFCWMAPFMVMGRKLRNALRWPSLRLVPDPAACTECGACASGCPMSLPVTDHVRKSDMEDPDCILCGECVSACPRKAIRFGFSRGMRAASSEASIPKS